LLFWAVVWLRHTVGFLRLPRRLHS
jgi:hypothetical protein